MVSRPLGTSIRAIAALIANSLSFFTGLLMREASQIGRALRRSSIAAASLVAVWAQAVRMAWFP